MLQVRVIIIIDWVCRISDAGLDRQFELAGTGANAPDQGQCQDDIMIVKAEKSGRDLSRSGGAVGAVVSSGKTKVFRSQELFAGVNEIVIEHDGEHYRLRATRKGKLILTK